MFAVLCPPQLPSDLRSDELMREEQQHRPLTLKLVCYGQKRRGRAENGRPVASISVVL